MTAGDDILLPMLEKRLDRLHARQRLGLEKDHEAQVFGQGRNFFHLENLTVSHALIGAALRLTGLYWRGVRNAAKVQLRHNDITSLELPDAFDGFTILQLSDLHADMSDAAMTRVAELLAGIDYDICVLTGDYRGLTFGPYAEALLGVERLRARIKGPIFGVLGNHNTICMVPQLEQMGIRMLLNEAEAIERGGERVHLAGVDDAHFYRMDSIEKAACNVPHDEFSILLSHTPEIYRQAAHADFNFLLAGHTHGGQICLPRGVPITLNCVLPRHMGSGAWKHHGMIGYTSVGAGVCIVPVRFNCPPEITLHRLHVGRPGAALTINRAARAN
ncbi:MAG TPA: metallophosphoesterase [Methyloceanibacter sp.]|nr:metallophosphoesterase [Methyloceanibacter sp.]